MIELQPEVQWPLYTIRRYTEQIYKVVKFKGLRNGDFIIDHSKDEHSETKLDPTYSRAKSTILELALCNPWQYFFTGTFNPEWYDRKNLQELNKVLSQWFRDIRKKYKCDMPFLLIPELHPKDKQSWHFHGLLGDIPPEHLHDFDPAIHPLKLCNKGYKWWDDFAKKFGHCSLSKIKNPVACGFYMTKYITKDLSGRAFDIGKHLYYASQNLNRSIPWAETISHSAELDRLLTEKYEFCEVGYSKLSDGLDWTFGLDGLYELLPLFEPIDKEDVPQDVPNDDLIENEFEQLYFPAG